MKIVDFHHADARSAVLPGKNGCVISGWKRGENGRFEVVRRRNARRSDLTFLRELRLVVHLPVVVTSHQSAVPVMELERRISEGVADAESGQRRAIPRMRMELAWLLPPRINPPIITL